MSRNPLKGRPSPRLNQCRMVYIQGKREEVVPSHHCKPQHAQNLSFRPALQYINSPFVGRRTYAELAPPATCASTTARCRGPGHPISSHRTRLHPFKPCRRHLFLWSDCHRPQAKYGALNPGQIIPPSTVACARGCNYNPRPSVPVLFPKMVAKQQHLTLQGGADREWIAGGHIIEESI